MFNTNKIPGVPSVLTCHSVNLCQFHSADGVTPVRLSDHPVCEGVFSLMYSGECWYSGQWQQINTVMTQRWNVMESCYNCVKHSGWTEASLYGEGGLFGRWHVPSCIDPFGSSVQFRLINMFDSVFQRKKPKKTPKHNELTNTQQSCEELQRLLIILCGFITVSITLLESFDPFLT